MYCAGAALRLARFNANIGVIDKRFFQGLPSPAAAALIAGFVWLAIDNKFPIREAWLPWAAFFLTVYAGFTMVSSAPFYSGKSFQLGRSVPFWVLVAAIALIFFVSVRPADRAVHAVLLLRAFGLCVSGVALVSTSAQPGQARAARVSPTAQGRRQQIGIARLFDRPLWP